MRDYDEFDDYGGGGFEKFTHRNGKKKKFKGHQSKHGKRSCYSLGDEGEYETYTPQPTITAHYTKDAVQNTTPRPINNTVTTPSTPGATPTYTPREHVFGPNTHTIKGVKIDFDGVDKIETIDRSKDGRMTYGVKFTFKGRQQAFRIIWFNMNQLERDRIYASEMQYWLKLQKAAKENQ